MGGSHSSCPNIIRELRAFHRTEQVHFAVLESPNFTRKNHRSHLIVLLPQNSSLARTENHEYYSSSLPKCRQRCSLVWVDVLCIAVETRATTTGSGALRRFPPRRKTQEPFLLKQVLDCTQDTTGLSSCFEGGK